MFTSASFRARALARAAVALGAAQLAACTPKVEAPGEATSNGNITIDAPDASLPSCEGEADGQPCGDGQHCIHEECLFNTCGDGIVAGNEQCDDGNQAVGDSCNPACRLTPITCGNTKVEAEEECDDGNHRDDDACSNGCTANRCGNMRVDPGEECDDGNAVNLDYCSNDCKRDQCRNGRVDPGEECDDGNAVTDDGCTNDCRILFCGDGKVYTEAGPLFEECEDGNTVNNDGCSNRCTKNVCGNNRVDPGEICDGLASTNPADPASTCNETCSMWKSDPCVACMKDKCNECKTADCSDAYSGLPGLYDICYVEATAKDPLFVLFGSVPYASYTANCAELDRCVRRNACSAPFGDDPTKQSGPEGCFCGNLSPNDCAKADALPGPCANEWFASVNGACDQFDGAAKVQCYSGSAADLSYAPGVEYYLVGCRWERCSSECGLSRASR